MRTARWFAVVAGLAAAVVAVAQDTWLGIYLQGSKIGYARSGETTEQVEGRSLRRIAGETRLESRMLGTGFSMRMESSTWLADDGSPVRMRFVTDSAGRRQTLEARFTPDGIDVDVDNNGQRTTKRLTPPPGARVVDDPTLLAREWVDGPASREVYVLDPVTAALVKNTVTVRRGVREQVDGAEFTVTVVEVKDPRATSRVLLDGTGGLVRVFGPLGMEMRPESESKARDLGGGGPVPDLGLATRLRTDRRIDRPDGVTRLVLEVSGPDLARMPSDAHQTVRRAADGVWRVEVHPVPTRGAASAALGAAAKGQPEWTRPDTLMPADRPRFRQHAARVVTGSKTVAEAAERLRRDVYGFMRVDSSIAVLRDAGEILDTKEGLCRDHAILLGTLLRAAGIPARLCAGLVYDDDAFFYHAWVEYWDGAAWIGLDSTRPAPGLTATHIKLAQGRLEDAFQFFVLDGAKLKVVATERSQTGTSR